MAGESEYEGIPGPSGVPLKRPRARLSANQKLRLFYLTGTEDPKKPTSEVTMRGGPGRWRPRRS